MTKLQRWSIRILCISIWLLVAFISGPSSAGSDAGVAAHEGSGLLSLGKEVTLTGLLCFVLYLLLAKGLPAILTAHQAQIALIMDKHAGTEKTLAGAVCSHTDLEGRRHEDQKEAMDKQTTALIDVARAIDENRPAVRAVVRALNKD